MTCTTATLKAIDGRKKELAQVRNVERNAIDQMVAGNTKDPYALFRPWVRDVADAGGKVEAYIEDIQMIILNAQKIVTPSNIASDFMKASDAWATSCKAINESLMGLDRHSLAEVQSVLIQSKNALDSLMTSVWQQWGLEGNVRDLGAFMVKTRRAA